MWSVNKLNEIRMTRGDTPSIGIVLTIEHEKKKYQYIPSENDYIVFALGGADGSPLLTKEIKDMTLCFSEEDTRNIPEGEYLYEISINSGDYRCTFISGKRFLLTKEIYTSKNPNSKRSGPAPESNLEKIVGVIPGGAQMSGQILLPTSILLDPTLTQSGKAADAKAVGDAIRSILSSGGGVCTSGREIELRKSETHVQWRYVGEAEWKDLISLEELKGNDYILADDDLQKIASMVEVNEIHETVENPYDDTEIRRLLIENKEDNLHLGERVEGLSTYVQNKLGTIESLIDELIAVAGGST